jgi:hypothetical protein
VGTSVSDEYNSAFFRVEVCCSETLLTTYQSTQPHNPEHNMRHPQHKNLQMFHTPIAGMQLHGAESYSSSVNTFLGVCATWRRIIVFRRAQQWSVSSVAHILTPYFLKDHINIILLKCPLPFMSVLNVLVIPHTYYTSCPSFNHPNNRVTAV